MSCTKVIKTSVWGLSNIYMGCFEDCFGPKRTRFMSFLLPEGRELFGSIQKLYVIFLISSKIQSFLVFLSIKVKHDFSEVKICVLTRFPVDSRFNGRPSKYILCSFYTFKPLVLAAITLNVVLAESDLEFFDRSTSSLMSFITALPSYVLVLSSELTTKFNFSRDFTEGECLLSR